jgi:hypothetical protein
MEVTLLVAKSHEPHIYSCVMLQTKALYNLLRFNAKDDPSIEAEPWALENLRQVPLEALWAKLAKLKIPLDATHFVQFAKECDTPEALADLLLDETQAKMYDPLYLILFELWRRFFPERVSLSIFCDELDFQIDRYDTEELQSDEPIQDGLANLLEILEEHVDQGMSPKVAFASVSEYLATDLVTFLYDYISELLGQGGSLYASELLEEFFPYMPDPIRFDCLSVRLLSETNIIQANQQIKSLLEQPLEIDLLFDLLHLLAAIGEHELFQAAIKKLLPSLTNEEEIEEMLDIAIEYYRRLDLDELEKAVLKIKKKRPLNLTDFQKLLFGDNVLLH